MPDPIDMEILSETIYLKKTFLKDGVSLLLHWIPISFQEKKTQRSGINYTPSSVSIATSHRRFLQE